MQRRHVVFTAIDGTLLDAETHDFSGARPMLQRLHATGVPVVPVTTMTLEEMEPIARELGIRHAMIIEYGGGIARWTDSAWEVEPCGPSSDMLLDAVREIEDRSGVDLTVYSVLPDDEAARLSGLSGEMLHRSTRRRFSEPFVVANGEVTEVIKAAASIGFSVRRGRRFLHLCRRCDEGEAFTRLREELRCEVAIALGDSPLDAEFLARAEIPIVVPRPDGCPDPDLIAKVPNARVGPAPGSAGWAAAVGEVLDAACLPLDIV
jgi:mannosyl-3-phosphoglycerate phosphatase